MALEGTRITKVLLFLIMTIFDIELLCITLPKMSVRAKNFN